MTLLCSQSNAIPIYLPDPTYIPPVISYHPSSSYICLSLYLGPIGPPTMIIMHVCKVRPDHFKVNWVEGRFQVNEWVQDYSWRGPMVVVWFALYLTVPHGFPWSPHGVLIVLMESSWSPHRVLIIS